LWILLATAIVVGILLVYAASTGAWLFMEARMGPGWWLMPVFMLLAMTAIMLAMMWPMISPGTGHEQHAAGGVGAEPEDAAAVAARRYASGAIPRAEYLQIREDIQGGKTP
jgi:uncharacterized membrane protein